MVPITVVTGHLLLSMHLSSQHLCKMELCYFSHFTDGEMKHREILDSDRQLTVLNVLTVCQLSQSHRHRQEQHPCLAGNAKWLRLRRRRITINVLPYTTLLHGNPGYSMLSPTYDHNLPFVTSQEQTHNYGCSTDLRLLALSPQFHLHLHRVRGLAGNQTTSPMSQEGNPIHWDFFIQSLFPTFSTVAHFLTDFSCHRLHFPFKPSQSGTNSLVIATVLLSLCLKLSIYLLSKPI